MSFELYARRRRLRRMRVRDDGSCWTYAALSCMDECEHAVPSNRAMRDATPNDRDNDRLLRSVLRQKYGFPEAVTKVPDYGAVGPDFFGSYGGVDELRALSEHLGVDTVLLDERDIDVERYHVLTRYGKEESWTLVDVEAHVQTHLCLHIARSRSVEDHYEAYVCQGVHVDIDDLSEGNHHTSKCDCGRDIHALEYCEFSGEWLQCDSCDRWCHKDCYASSNDSGEFMCRTCTASHPTEVPRKA